MRPLAALAGTVVALAALSGCSSSGPAISAASSTPMATVTAKALAADCTPALAVLPAEAPATAKQAYADYAALGGHSRGGTVDSLADAVGADSSSIAFDFSMNESDASDVKAWDKDAAALRAYCS